MEAARRSGELIGGASGCFLTFLAFLCLAPSAFALTLPSTGRRRYHTPAVPITTVVTTSPTCQGRASSHGSASGHGNDTSALAPVLNASMLPLGDVSTTPPGKRTPWACIFVLF